MDSGLSQIGEARFCFRPRKKEPVLSLRSPLDIEQPEERSGRLQKELRLQLRF